MSGLDANQQHNTYFEQLETVIRPGHFPTFVYQCCCHFHSQHCQEYNQSAHELFLKHQTPPQPFEQTQPTPGDGQPASQLRSDLDYEMKDASETNGGKIDEMENSKQPAEGVMDPAQTPEAATVSRHRYVCADSVNSTDKTCEGGREQDELGSRYGRPDEVSVFHDCCSTPCVTGKYISHAPSEKKRGIIKMIMKAVGATNDHDEQQDSMSSEKSQSKDNSRKDNEELRKIVNEMQAQSEQKICESKETLRRKDDELRRKEEELRDASEGRKSDQFRIASLSAKLQDIKTRYEGAAKSHDSQVANLTTKVAQFKSDAERLSGQLSTLEQSNSKSVGGTGAHKDSHAIPPNLVKSVFVVNEAAFACTKTFFTFLKDRKALQSHVALQNMPVWADERYRKYAVESYICSRLFAGFENDSYVDSLDCAQGSHFLPASYEETEFFLKYQDLEVRLKRYADEYDSLQGLGLQGVMDLLKSNKAAGSTNSFHQFCCRKLVNLLASLDGWFKEFELLYNADHSKHSVLHQLATNPKYCDKFLKPFVNLAMVAFLLHRLAFQFSPPARIFRYAKGTKFDRTYMENAVPIDDDDTDEEFFVGLMLVPGFQVGATIVKCTVYLIPSSRVKTPSNEHAN